MIMFHVNLQGCSLHLVDGTEVEHKILKTKTDNVNGTVRVFQKSDMTSGCVNPGFTL